MAQKNALGSVTRSRSRDRSPSVNSDTQKIACYTGLMTHINSSDVGNLTDRELLSRLRDAAHTERTATARLIALLMECDTRRLYLGEGCSYCAGALQDSIHRQSRDI